MTPKTDIIGQFEYSVREYPENIAVSAGNTRLTYDQLNRNANSLAHLIRKSPSDGGGNVALLLDHDPEMIVGILGVLKAGKTYVPIDASFPLERSKKILNDSGAVTLITNNHQLSLAYKLLGAAKTEIKIINIAALDDKDDKDQGLKISADQPAYVLYTSGSTGTPKGVMQPHGSIVRFINSYIGELDIRESDNILLTTPYSHTVAVIDIFSALFAGACLSILNIKKDFSVQEFGACLEARKISILHTVPTFYRYFIRSLADRSQLDSVRLVILGGEEVFQNDVELYKNHFSDECLFINLYGSSEVILAAMHVINKDYTDDQKILSIGYPFDFVKSLILDDNGKTVQAYGIGEIYFSSPFLHPAYYKDPQLTKSLYTDQGDNERYVRMGDLVRLLQDGSLELIGRKDTQVKINGNRVHMNEIEVNLDGDGSVIQSVVVPIRNDAGEIALVAYMTTDEAKPDIEGIKERLRKMLPEYMIPSFFVKLDKMPITPNGKIDRNNLPRIGYGNLKENNGLSEKTEWQKTILKIWKTVFEKEDITVYDNFFQLGGNSLMATEIVNRIISGTGVEIGLSSVFDHQSVFELARFIGRKEVEQVI